MRRLLAVFPFVAAAIASSRVSFADVTYSLGWTRTPGADPRLVVVSEPSGPPSSLPPIAAPVVPPRDPQSALPPPATTVDDLHGEAQLGIAVAGGLLPGIATGLTLNQGVRAGDYWIELGGTLWAPREANVEAGRGATFSLLALTGRFCPFAVHENGFLVLACGGVGAGLLIAQGFGFDQSERARRPAVFASVALEGSGRIAGRLWAGVRLSGLLPVLREQFVFKTASGRETEVFRMNAVAGSAELTLGVRF